MLSLGGREPLPSRRALESVPPQHLNGTEFVTILLSKRYETQALDSTLSRPTIVGPIRLEFP